MLFNARGERVELSPSGAAIVGIFVRDRQGRVGDVSVAEGGHAGKTIGRYANRIGGARFSLDGVEYKLELITITSPLRLPSESQELEKYLWPSKW